MTATASIVLIVLSLLSTVAIKAVGPILVGGRELPPWVNGVFALIGPALFAGLVITQVFADGDRLHVADETVGVLTGGALALRGTPMILCIAVAVVLTAILRA